jgi:hypothetical protein
MHRFAFDGASSSSICQARATLRAIPVSVTYTLRRLNAMLSRTVM